MDLKELIVDAREKSIVALGNEAICRGAVEAGVQAVYSYPGTPSSEIIDTFAALAKDIGLYVEIAANEKIAMEGAFAAAASGLRALFCCKHVGMNVAADVLMSIAYMGTRGGLVLISGDDPGMHSSQNEQDNRWFGRFGNLVVMTPSDAQESQKFVRDAFEISEKYELPIILRTTTRVNHSRSNITYDAIKKVVYPQATHERTFSKDPKRFVCLPMNARANHVRVLNKLKEFQQWAEKSSYNTIYEGTGSYGIITSGVSFTYTMEARRELQLECPVLKLGIEYPLPIEQILNFITHFNLKTLIIVEENDPVVELEIRALLNEKKLMIDVLGKNQGVTSYLGELDTLAVMNGLSVALKLPVRNSSLPITKPENLISRPPILCPGCPHRATFYALNRASRNQQNIIVSTDIGCYTLGYMPPLNVGDFSVCMGSSIGVASGLSHSGLKEDIVAVIGDSTFWHAGLSSLASAVYNRSKFTLVIVDNFITAMTGMQEHPSTGKLATGELRPPLSIEQAVKGLGVEFVKITNAFKLKETVDTFKEAFAYNGVSVILSKGICQIRKRELRRAGEKYPYPEVAQEYFIDPDVCIGCATCATKFGCPAISWSDKKTAKGKKIPKIDPLVCDPCGMCAQVCPQGAIKGRNKSS